MLVAPKGRASRSPSIDRQDPIADLKKRLGRGQAIDKIGAFWSRRETSRRVRISATIDTWWSDHGFHGHPATVGKRVAVALIEQHQPEAKIAGIVILHELLGEQLRAADVPIFAQLFCDRHLSDRNLADWFAVKVLGTLLERVPGRVAVARAIAEWRTAETSTQRRAACRAFMAISLDPKVGPTLAPTILTLCAAVVWSTDACDQTAVGALLKQLSFVEPGRVEAFVRRYARFMSKACVRTAVERIPRDRRTELLAGWKRATTIRRHS